MHTLVVQSHPLTDSYNAALLASVTAGLEASGDGFDVCRIAQGERPTSAQLAAAEQLVLVYPTWWGGQPASLLDWLRDVVADRLDLAAVRHFVVVTTCGSSQLVNRVQGEWGRRYLEKRVLPLCAPGTELEWVALYKIDRQSQSVVTSFARDLEHRFALAAS